MQQCARLPAWMQGMGLLVGGIMLQKMLQRD